MSLGALLYGSAQGLRNILLRGVGVLHHYRRLVIFTTATVATMAVSDEYLFEISKASGSSMYPTIPDHYNHMFVNKRFRNGRGIQVGDCVQIRSPLFRKQYSGKRVIGLPGDYVLRSKHMNPTPGGAPLPGITDWKERLENGEEAPREEEEWDEPEMIQVPEGHVWVEGDNLSWSRDSRFFGPVPMALIRGRSSWWTDGLFSFSSLKPGRALRRVEDDEMAAVLGG